MAVCRVGYFAPDRVFLVGAVVPDAQPDAVAELAAGRVTVQIEPQWSTGDRPVLAGVFVHSPASMPDAPAGPPPIASGVVLMPGTSSEVEPVPLELDGDPLDAIGGRALVSYARVSTGEQVLDRQLDAFGAVRCVRVFVEKQSGKDADRPDSRRAWTTCAPATCSWTNRAIEPRSLVGSTTNR